MNNDTWSKTFTISFSKTLVIGFAISVVLSGIYWVIMHFGFDYTPEPNEMITLFSGFLIGISLIIASKSLEVNREIHLERIAYDNTMFFQNIVSHWYNDLSEHVANSRNILLDYESSFSNKSKAKDMIDHFYDNPEEMESFYAVLNYLEHLSLMVEQGIIEQAKIKSSFGTVYKTYYTKTKYFIDALREQDGDHKKETFCSFEKLAQRWL